MTVDLPPLWEDLVFLSPLSPARADRLAAWLAEGLGADDVVLDVGCGWAELLLRVVAAAPSAYGVGIDLETPRIEEARRRAAERGLADRVRLHDDDASTASPDRCAAIICVGSSQVWGPDVEDGQPLDYRAALRAMRERLPRGGRLVYGEAIWSRTPTPEATAPLSGRDDEFVALHELTRLACDAGFAVVAVQEADLDEWDAFESGFTARQAHWLATHEPDHPDADDVRRQADAQRAGYLDGYRGVLGLAYLQLIAV
jgi:cyclopropane fatty-acyl-phospholipid synthase-like methyltransferase